jgi:hypothetical protein
MFRTSLRMTGAALRVVLVAVAVLTVSATSAHAKAARSDSWVTTRTAAQSGLKDRFKNIARVSCAPDRTSATLLRGTTRYWQRFSCQGHTFDSASFRLSFKMTGRCASCWAIFSLRGTDMPHLKTPSPKNSPPDGGGSGPTTSCHPSYEGACLDPNASDYDCAGGSGNGPSYTGPVRVVGPDVFRLDADGDGYACE